MNSMVEIEKVQKWADAKHQKYYRQYQQIGSAVTMKTAERYEDISDICELAKQARESEDGRKAVRLRNINSMIEKVNDRNRLGHTTWTIEEVVELLEQTKWM